MRANASRVKQVLSLVVFGGALVSCTATELTVGKNDPANPHAATAPMAVPQTLGSAPASPAPAPSQGDPHAGHLHGGQMPTGMKMETPPPDKSAATKSPEAPTSFTCPMHSNIVRSEPGNCPICGMTLKPMPPMKHDGEKR